MSIDLGTRKQVFIDWSLIDPGYGLPWGGVPTEPRHMPYGVRISVHPPTVQPAPILTSQHPWEDVLVNAFCTLLQDDGVLRLYYEAYGKQAGEALLDNSARLCYAESHDGRNWKRKMVGVAEFGGARENNIVYLSGIAETGGSGVTVFKDPSAPPAERYKLVHGATLPNPGGWHRISVICGAVSADGFHWKPIEQPLLRHPSDTQTVVQYDANAGVYRAFLRGLVPSHDEVGRDFKDKAIHGRRVVDQSVTKDFRNWPAPEPAMRPEPLDPPDWDIYNNSYTQWPGATDAHLMFPSFFGRSRGPVEVHLLTSRDGRKWSRMQRGPILPAGEPGALGVGGIYAGQGLAALTDSGIATDLQSAKQWVMPVAPQKFPHNATEILKERGGVWLATIRPDGFTSLSAEDRGECWTFPFVFSGKNLLINSWARFGGNVRFGLEDKDGPIAGYGVTDCDPLEGDCLWKPVAWRGKTDLSPFAGKQIILHIQLIRSRLHAFRFA